MPQRCLDILGLTFDELAVAAAARPRAIPALRAAYRRLMRGEAAEVGVDEAGVTLQAAVHPVVRRQETADAAIASSEEDQSGSLRDARRDSRGSRCEKGFSHQHGSRGSRCEKGFSHQHGKGFSHQHGSAGAAPSLAGRLIKFVQRTGDGLETESVIVPMRRKTESWKSLCVSSQIGCGRGCAFCETARMGLLRQLSAAEIVGQAVAARREFNAEIRNVVFMGMGEPLDNFDAVVQAVRVLSDRSGLSIGKPQICISTAGRADGVRRLAGLGWRRLNIAVSLNAPNDEIRSRLMPINRSIPMGALREALLEYPLRTCQFFMIEYVLIAGVNDSPEHARELAEFLRPVKCCVNVIPYNPCPGLPFEAPAEEAVRRFSSQLRLAGQYCKRRLTKGREQMAACGQLGNRALSRRT